MITVVSWNIGRRLQSVEELLAMEADVSLLQEVGPGALEALKETGGNVAVSPQVSLFRIYRPVNWEFFRIYPPDFQGH